MNGKVIFEFSSLDLNLPSCLLKSTSTLKLSVCKTTSLRSAVLNFTWVVSDVKAPEVSRKRVMIKAEKIEEAVAKLVFMLESEGALE